ncbi:hypothetical protein GCM10017044_10850 [Kordiimonas sediminis]|uniref:Laminin G domain-containing protein n=1 Tax=Kordiimonas sediminis TaxID=1735581 RepID=A0A919E491_9PROT|nr:hypothetical protein [Kordiimonas sediminis]GHF18168.1 hypothetical protein GCM10017044_10850 [Kordiimonas sediminis]
MATLRTLHIGAGQGLVPGVSYPTYQAFFDDIGTGLPSDLVGADEDWLLLFYGDGVTPLTVSGVHRFDSKLTGASGRTVTFSPAVGHGFWDTYDPATDPLTYHGASRGVTLSVGAWSSFCGSGSAGLGLRTVVTAGFQFLLANNGARILDGNTGVLNSLDGCLVYDMRQGNYSDIVRTSSGAGDTAHVENCIFFTRGGRVINAASLSGTSRVSNNIIVYMGAGTNLSPAVYSDHGVSPGDKEFYNTICTGYQTVYSNNQTSKLACWISDGMAADNPAVANTAGSEFGILPQDVFTLWPADPVVATAVDFDLRLRAEGPAIGSHVASVENTLTDAAGGVRQGPQDAGPLLSPFVASDGGAPFREVLNDSLWQRYSATAITPDGNGWFDITTSYDSLLRGAHPLAHMQIFPSGLYFACEFQTSAPFGTTRNRLFSQGAVHIDLLQSGGVEVTFVHASGQVVLTSSGSVPAVDDGSPHSLSVTWDGTALPDNVQIKIDGSTIGTGSFVDGPLLSTTAPLTLGAALDGFQGKVRNIQLANRPVVQTVLSDWAGSGVHTDCLASGNSGAVSLGAILQLTEGGGTSLLGVSGRTGELLTAKAVRPVGNGGYLFLHASLGSLAADCIAQGSGQAHLVSGNAGWGMFSGGTYQYASDRQTFVRSGSRQIQACGHISVPRRLYRASDKNTDRTR